jgi:hypothetical protein
MRSWDGTSMATPHVSGVAGLIRSYTGKDFSATQMKQILVDSSDLVPALNGKTIGAGKRLNVLKALQLAQTITPQPPTFMNAVPVTVTSASFVQAGLNLNQGNKALLFSWIVSACTGMSQLTSGSYVKNVFKLNGLPTTGTMNVDNCAMPTRFDTVTAVLVCPAGYPGNDFPAASGACACYTNDDACVASGGDRVSGVPLAPGKDIYAVVVPFGINTASGAYSLTVTVAGGTFGPPA